MSDGQAFFEQASKTWQSVSFGLFRLPWFYGVNLDIVSWKIWLPRPGYNYLDW